MTSLLARARSALPEIIEVADSVPEAYRQPCFNLLLSAVLQHNSADGAARATGASFTALVGNGRLLKLMEEAKVTEDQLVRIIDPNGAILVKTVGRNKAEKQRNLGLLTALSNAILTGEANIPDEQLREVCRRFDAFDGANFATTMKAAAHEGASIFVKTDDGWRLSAPGEEALVKLIGRLNNDADT